MFLQLQWRGWYQYQYRSEIANHYFSIHRSFWHSFVNVLFPVIVFLTVPLCILTPLAFSTTTWFELFFKQLVWTLLSVSLSSQVARWEHRTRTLTRLFGSPYLTCYCMGFTIILLNVYRSYRWSTLSSFFSVHVVFILFIFIQFEFKLYKKHVWFALTCLMKNRDNSASLL